MSTLTLKQRIESDLSTKTPSQVFSEFIPTNDQFFISSSLEDSRDILEERTAIYDVLISNWFKSIVKKVDYQKPLACIAHGGFGRKEMTPFSDVDVGFLVEDNLVSERLQEVLNEETSINGHTDPIREKLGFSFHAAFYTLEDIANPEKFNAPQVNSLCDSRVLFDQGDFAQKFIKGVLRHRKVFSHLDYLVGEWKKIISETKYGLDNLNYFNIKEDMGGLRHFQLGLRIPNIADARSLNDLYPLTYFQNSEVMHAYDFLLRMRGVVHLLKKQKFENKTLSKEESDEANTVNYQDYTSLGEIFGPQTQKRLLESRRIIANHSDMEIGKVLKRGYTHDGFTYGPQGIFISDTEKELKKLSAKDKQKKLFKLLEVSQTQSLPVDLVEFIDRFRNASEWVTPSEDFAKLFYSDGQIPRTLELLNRLGAYNKCLPGAEELEISIPRGGHRGQFLTSTAFGRQKVADFTAKLSESEVKIPGRFNFTEVAKQLSLEDKTGIYLAYQTARIPVVLGLTAESYYSTFQKEFNSGFSEKTLDTTKFLIKNRDLLSTAARDNINNFQTVERVAKSIGDSERLKVLRAYTEVDLARKHENSHIWPVLDELYFKVKSRLEGSNENSSERFDRNNFSDEQLEILDDLGQEVKNGVYSELALRLLPKFVKVKSNSTPYLDVSRTMDGNELHLCTPDFKGLLRLVSGKCYESGLDITQVHAYTLPRSDIAFDVFHLANLPSNFSRTDWLSSLSNTLKTRNGLTTDPRDILKGLEYHWNLDDLQDDGLRRLTFETKEHRPGYLFALSSGLYDSVGANIYAAKSSRENGDTFRVFFKSPQRDLKKVEDSLSDYFSQHK